MISRAVEVFGGGVIFIAGILAGVAAAGYVLWWVAVVAASRFPMIGKRHRHESWDRLNRR